MELITPQGYNDLTPDQKAEICNGCGPKGYGIFVPDQFGIVNFTPACNRHDYGYHVAKTVKEVRKHNCILHRNMVIIIKGTLPGNYLKWARKIMYTVAHEYYWAVETYGTHFWKPKEAS